MEKTLRQRRLEVLEDTVKYYSEDINRRCFGDGDDPSECRYSPKSVGKEGISQGCAVGRLLPQEMKDEIDETYGAVNIDDLVSYHSYALPKEVISLGVNFLVQLQRLHDKNEHWSKSGLSDKGQLTVNEIKETFKLQ